jgi:hypothetical protein
MQTLFKTDRHKIWRIFGVLYAHHKKGEVRKLRILLAYLRSDAGSTEVNGG